MKRHGDLYERITSMENLMLADDLARKSKKRKECVALHDQTRMANLLTLQKALRERTYKTSTYTHFKVYEPKERDIFYLPYYPDQIVQYAIINVVGPIWLRTFTYNTYCCIRGRGIHACAKRTRHIINSFKGLPLYCLKIDIRKYYPNIDNAILKKIVRRKIKDADLLWLLDEFIDSAEGLPIGNYLSQYLSNLYLSYFMHWVNEVLRVKATEYADDIVFYSDSKEELHHVLEKVREYLHTEMNLDLKGNEQIFPIAQTRQDRHGRALDYVGYNFYRENTLLRKSIKQSFCRRVRTLNRREKLPPKEYKMAISAWLGWAKYANSRHLLKTIIKKDYYAIIIEQKARCA